MNSLISPAAPFSLTQPQKLTEPPPSLPDNFKDTNSDSSSKNAGSISNNGSAWRPKRKKELKQTAR